jgi:hypothetical protein
MDELTQYLLQIFCFGAEEPASSITEGSIEDLFLKANKIFDLFCNLQISEAWDRGQTM